DLVGAFARAARAFGATGDRVAARVGFAFAPRVRSAVGDALGLLPFRFARQALALVLAEDDGLLVVDAVDRLAREARVRRRVAKRDRRRRAAAAHRPEARRGAGLLFHARRVALDGDLGRVEEEIARDADEVLRLLETRARVAAHREFCGGHEDHSTRRDRARVERRCRARHGAGA